MHFYSVQGACCSFWEDAVILNGSVCGEGEVGGMCGIEEADGAEWPTVVPHQDRGALLLLRYRI